MKLLNRFFKFFLNIYFVKLTGFRYDAIWRVEFISDEHSWNFITMILNFKKPFFNTDKCLWICNVINNYYSVSTSIICRRYSSKSFLSGGVPNLKKIFEEIFKKSHKTSQNSKKCSSKKSPKKLLKKVQNFKKILKFI